MPLTGMTTFLGAVVMAVSYILVSRRIRVSQTAPSPQVGYLRDFFVHLMLFFLLMCAPSVLITSSHASQFPAAMAWGYCLGHIFLYTGLAEIVRLTFSMVPRLANKGRWAIILCYALGAAITVLNIKTMVFGIQPAYDPSHDVILFNTQKLVGAAIAAFAALATFPAAILLVMNGFRNPNARVRSFLLGGGLFLLMAAGPIHDNAKTGTIYAMADLLSSVSLILIAGGVLYRFEEKLSWTKGGAVAADSNGQHANHDAILSR